MWISLAVVSGLATLVLTGWVGWLVRGSSPHHDVTMLNSFTGTVTTVNATGSAGCIQPTDGGRTVCSIFVLFHDQSVHQGDTVHAALEQFIPSSGDGYQWLVILPPKTP